nr:ELWxxDGT repeat protein [Azospirillum lipoferum]
MFDAAGAATADQATAGDHAADPVAASHDSTDHSAGPSLAQAVAEVTPAATAPVEIRAADPARNDGRKDVVFVETNTAGYQTLVDGVKAGVEVVLLDSNQDGLSQMAEWAKTHTGYDAIHIISHGAEGQISLGSVTLDSATAESRSADLAALGAALKADGDLLLYGCSVASKTGSAFIATLADLSGADVAASTNPTGATAKGGDGLLEFSHGTVADGARSIISFSGFDGLLSTPDTTPPTVDAANSVPAHGTTAVAVDADIVIDFSENIALGTSGKITLYNMTSRLNTAVFDVSTASGGGITLSDGSTLTISGDKLTINPSGILASASQFTVLFTAGSITDTAATPNPIAAVTDGTAYSFTTGIRVIFNGFDNTAGGELFATDGTTSGTFLLKDINPGTNSSDAQAIVLLPNGKMLFSANDGTNGTELWITDGTAAGTVLVKDINGGSGGSNPGLITTLSNGKILFGATDATNGNELWITDGTQAGTTLVKDINPGSGNSSLSNLIALNDGRMLFVADDGTHGRELWITDGTTAGTVLLKDIQVGSSTSNLSNFTKLSNGSVLFLADDGTNGQEPWITDGTTAGTVLLKDINAGSTGSSASSFVALPNGTALFGATNGSTNNGSELWITDGTANGTVLLKDIESGTPGSSPTNFALLSDGKVLFSASTSTTGRELWITDGTANGTVLVKDINSGSSGSNPTSITVMPNGKAVLAATTSTSGQELWVTDGTANGTTLLKEIRSGSNGSSPTVLTLLADGRVMFKANDGTSGSEPWITDGTTAGTFLLKDINSGSLSSSVSYIVSFKPLALNQLPVIGNLGSDAVTVAPTDDATVIDQGTAASASDADAASFNDGTLTVSIGTGRVTGEDFLGIRNQGTATGQVGASGGTVTYGGAVVGTYTGGTGADDLVVTFNGSATAAVVSAVLQNITFDTSGTTSGDRTVNFTLTDGIGGTSSTASVTATVANANAPPVIGNLDGDSVAWAGEGQTVLLDAGTAATASDTENGAGSWTGSVLTVRRSVSGTATPLPSDIFSFNSNASFSESGGSLLDTANSNAVFGTVTNANGTLTVTFNGSATATLIQTVMRNILYRNDTPTGDTVIRYSLTDGNGGSTTADVTVTSDTIYVTNTADDAGTGVADGVGLREAVAIALADTTGSQTIKFASGLANGTITLGSGLAVTENLTFDSDAASGLTIAGSTITVSTGTVLTISNGGSDTLTVSSKLSGSGAVTKSGAGTATLSGSNDYSGATTVSTGTLTVDGGIGDSSAVTVSSGATLDLSGSETIGSLAGAGSVTLNGNTLTTGVANSSTSFDGVISGTGGLTKTGTGTLTLSGANSYTGATTVSAGTLTVSGGSAIADDNAVSVSSGATLALSAAETIGSLSGAGNVTLGANTLTVSPSSGSTSFSGVLSGTGGLTKSGAGSLTLSGANTYTGATTVSGGTLTVSGVSVIADGSAVTVASGATLSVPDTETVGSIAGAGAIVLGGTLTAGGNNTSTEFSGVISGSGGGSLVKQGSGTLTLSGTNTHNGGTSIFAGTIIAASTGGLGASGVDLAAGTTLSFAVTGSFGNYIQLSGAATIDVGSGYTATLSNTIDGSFDLTKSGAGTLTLSGSSTYSGSTTVSAGTVLVTGALGDTSGVTVASGATLGGTGSIFASGSSNTLTVASGATLAPGVAGTNNGIGSLTVNGNLSMSGTLAVEIAGTTAGSGYDQVIVSGGVTLASGSSAVTVARVNSFAAVNAATYTVVNQTGSGAVSNTLSGLAQGDTLSTNGDLYTVDYVGGTGNDLVVTALVNPTVSSVSATTADGTYKAGSTVTITVTFNRAVTVTGTPALALGITGRSATYSGGSGTTALTFTYTVQDGDNSADLDYASTGALTLNGGSIADSSTSLDAILTLATPGAANSLGANKAIVIDTAAPGASSAPDMTAGSDTGSSSIDNITKTTTPTFTGTAEANSTVTLYDTDGTTVLGTTAADGSGNWSITSTPLSAGTHTVTAKVTDAAGNVSSVSSGLAVTIDTSAPGAPGTPTLGSGSDTGTSVADGITSTATPTFTGIAEAGSTVTLYDTDGTTVLGTGTADGSGNYSITVSTLTAGTHSVTAKATDSAGNVSSVSPSQSVTIDATAPTVSSVTASTANGTYKSGDTVTITVAFSEVVHVTGTPTLALNSGGTATYAGGSGSSTLTFTYTVGSGETAADLDYGSTGALSGTIRDTAGNSATLTLPATGGGTSLGGAKDIVIDTTAPTVSSVTVPADATYLAGGVMEFTVTFSEAVTVGGAPTLPITFDNGEVAQAAYVSGSGGRTLTFRYTVPADKSDADGIVVGRAVVLNGGSIKDAVGNEATLTLNGTPGTGGVKVDSVIPTVDLVTSPTANGSYTTGDTVTLTVTFSEAVTVTGAPTLSLNTGRSATYAGGSGGKTLSFTYTVQSGDTAADLDAGALSLNSGTIKDASGNTATLTLPTTGAAASLGGSKDIAIDTTPPSIVNVVVPADGMYGVGRTLSVFVQFSETVAVAGGTPSILIDVGGVTREAVYNAVGSTNTVLRFDYVVQAGDNDLNGIEVKQLSMHGATIADLARTPAPTTLNGVPGTQGVLIDTEAPAAPSAPVLAAGQDSGASATDGLTNINRPTISGTAEAGSTVTVLVFGVALGTTTADANGQWSFTFATPLADGARSITTTATDLAGNVSAASPPLALTIDATATAPAAPGLAAGSDNGSPTSDRITSVTRPTLTGTAEPNSTVNVILDGALIGTVTAGADGIWSFTVATALSDGDHSVQTTATDRAGNTGTSPSQSFTVRTTTPAAPGAPTLASGDSGASSSDGLTNVTQPTLQGTATANGTVTVFVDGSAAGTARVDASGGWSLTLGSALSDGTHRVQVSATDAVGNAGTQLSDALVITVDTRGPTVSVGGTAPSLGTGATVSIGSGVSLSDASALDRVTVTLTDARAGDELVIGALPDGITATRDGNRIVLSGVASVADYQAAVRAIGLRSSASDPSFAGAASSRSISVSARDAAGNESGLATIAVTVPGSAVPATAPTTANSPSSGSFSNPFAGSSSAPALPGDSGGLTNGSSSTDAGRWITLGSISGGSSSSDAGRSITLSSIGGQGSGGSGSSSSSLSGGIGSSGSSGGSALGGGLGGGWGGGLGAGGDGLGGSGLGSGLPGSPNNGGIGTGTPSGTGPTDGNGQPRGQAGPRTGTPQRGTAPDQGAPGRGQGNANQGNAPADEGRGQPPNPQGQDRGGTDAPDGSTSRQDVGQRGGGTGGQADVALVGRVSPGFAHQVARAYGGPAGASALLAALANHVLPESRAS